MRTVNLWLLCLAILAVLVAVIPKAQTCYLPPNAPTRGFYEACWTFEEIVR